MKITLQELREAAGLSVAEAADQIGVTRQSLWRWEAGLVVPGGLNLKMLEAWAERLRKKLGAGKIRWPWEEER